MSPDDVEFFRSIWAFHQTGKLDGLLRICGRITNSRERIGASCAAEVEWLKHEFRKSNRRRNAPHREIVSEVAERHGLNFEALEMRCRQSSKRRPSISRSWRKSSSSESK